MGLPNRPNLCMNNKKLFILLALAIIFGYLVMIHQFGHNAIPNIDNSQSDQVIIANDILSHFAPNQNQNQLMGIIKHPQMNIINNDNPLNQIQ